jgi:hypothetical protein
VLWFALAVITVAGVTLAMFRLSVRDEPPARLRRRPPPRPYAPDDDEEFLRSLSRKRD